MLDREQDLGTISNLTGAFMAHHRKLVAFVRLRCCDGSSRSEIDDILHELWLRCSNADACNVSDPKSYLYRMAHNLILDRSRRALRGRECEGDWNYRHVQSIGGCEPAMAERRLLAKEHLERIDGALRAVGERAAWIFRRYRIDGALQGTIADELGVSLSTVEKDLRKAYDAVFALRELSDDG